MHLHLLRQYCTLGGRNGNEAVTYNLIRSLGSVTTLRLPLELNMLSPRIICCPATNNQQKNGFSVSRSDNQNFKSGQNGSESQYRVTLSSMSYPNLA